jgi:hypothetical protein
VRFDVLGAAVEREAEFAGGRLGGDADVLRIQILRTREQGAEIALAAVQRGVTSLLVE